MPLTYYEEEVNKLKYTHSVHNEQGDEPPLLAATRGMPESVAFESQDGKKENETENKAETAQAEEPQWAHAPTATTIIK
jgi:hypothetical protein